MVKINFYTLCGVLLCLLAASIMLFIYPSEQAGIEKAKVEQPATYDDRAAISPNAAVIVLGWGILFIIKGFVNKDLLSWSEEG